MEQNLDDVIGFRKHAGKTIMEVCKIDPGYILWLHANISTANFSIEVIEFAEFVQKNLKSSKKDNSYKPKQITFTY